MGELLLQIQKASGHYAESENRPTSKNTITSEMGMTKDQVSQYQQMAQNPEAVQAAINLVKYGLGYSPLPPGQRGTTCASAAHAVKVFSFPHLRTNETTNKPPAIREPTTGPGAERKHE